MSVPSKGVLVAAGLWSMTATAWAQDGAETMPAALRALFASEQYAHAVWLDCSTGSMRMKLAMQLLSRPDTDYGAVHHLLSPFAADGSSLGLVEALSDWAAEEIDPDVIATRFRLHCVEQAAAERT
jgi:hypothetical protein